MVFLLVSALPYHSSQPLALPLKPQFFLEVPELLQLWLLSHLQSKDMPGVRS